MYKNLMNYKLSEMENWSKEAKKFFAQFSHRFVENKLKNRLFQVILLM